MDATDDALDVDGVVVEPGLHLGELAGPLGGLRPDAAKVVAQSVIGVEHGGDGPCHPDGLEGGDGFPPVLEE